MMLESNRIVRFDEPFAADPDVYNPRRIIREESTAHAEDDEPVFKLSGVLRGGQAALVSEAREVQLRAFEADFPLPADQNAEPPPRDEETIRAEVEAEWRSRMEEMALRVREEAYEAGYATAREELEAKTNDKLKCLDEQSTSLKNALTEHLAELERVASALAMDAAATVLEAPLTDTATRAAERALSQALEQLAGDGAIEIVMHPIDLLRVQEQGFDAQLNAAFPGIRWIPDENMDEGDWSARTTEAVIRRIRKEMLDLLSERLGIESKEETE
jgi:flagellar biosynthesis/type III secretory pathway protein FliH